jgi:F-type H+-transporting ATPase subunit delta
MLRRILSVRKFSTDTTIASRYAGAAFNAAKESNVVDHVYNDLASFRDLLEDNNFRLLVQSPGIKATERSAALKDIGGKIKANDLTMNFLDLLIEKQRMGELKKVVDLFEVEYRKFKGQIVCLVSSADVLNANDRERIEKALKLKAKGKDLIVNFEVSQGIVGGLLVKMGDAVFDYTVASKVDRLHTELLKSVE